MKVRKFQEGGPVNPQEQGAPQGGGQPQEGQPQQGGGAEEQIMQMAQQIIEQVGPEGAAMLAEAIMQMVQGAGGQAAPAAPAPEGQPVMARRGGRLSLIARR